MDYSLANPIGSNEIDYSKVQGTYPATYTDSAQYEAYPSSSSNIATNITEGTTYETNSVPVESYQGDLTVNSYQEDITQNTYDIPNIANSEFASVTVLGDQTTQVTNTFETDISAFPSNNIEYSGDNIIDTNNIIETNNYQTSYQADEYNVDTNIVSSPVEYTTASTPIEYPATTSPVEYSTSETPVDYTTETPIDYTSETQVNYTTETPVDYTATDTVEYNTTTTSIEYSGNETAVDYTTSTPVDYTTSTPVDYTTSTPVEYPITSTPVEYSTSSTPIEYNTPTIESTVTNTYDIGNTYNDTNYYETSNTGGINIDTYTTTESVSNNYIPEIRSSFQNFTTDYSAYKTSSYNPSSQNYIDPSVNIDTTNYTHYQTSSLPVNISSGYEDPDTEIIPVEEIEYVPVKKKKYIKRKKVKVVKTVVIPKKVIVPVPVKKTVYIPKKEKVIIQKPKITYQMKPTTTKAVPMMPIVKPLAKSSYTGFYKPRVYRKKI